MAESGVPKGSWAVAGFGVLLGLLAVGLAMRVLLHGGITRVVLLSVLIPAGTAVAAYFWISYKSAAERLADKEREFGTHHFTRYSSPLPTSEEPKLSDDTEDDEEAERARKARTNRKRFVKMATSHLNEQFRRHAPTTQAGRRRWESDTRGLKESLKNELLTRYKEPELAVGALDWLIRYRVREIARTWQEGTLHDFRKQLQPRLRDLLAAGAGTFVGAAALIYALALTVIRQPVQAVLVILLLVIAGGAITVSQLDVHLVRKRRLPGDKEEAKLRDGAEVAEYRKWVDDLSDRPSDPDMARWLDYDKLFVKKLVMSHLGLVSRDILSHATLTEHAPGSRLARVPHGPARATVYWVTVFLLTRDGVRQVRTKLNFSSGNLYDQQRRSFRYDVITSASVDEVGVRYDTGRREAVPLPDNPWTTGMNSAKAVALQEEPQRKLNGSIILRREFLLSLGNREQITFLVENLDDAWGQSEEEDPLSLLDLALDTSGVAAALEVLEAISGHGAQWVEERIRRRRRWA